MGTYYTLGIVKKFTAQTNAAISQDDWLKTLNERFDLTLFDLTFEDKTIKAQLKQNIFTADIADFFEKLKTITGMRHIDYFHQEYGDRIDDYPHESDRFTFVDSEKNEIKMFVHFIFVFTEGKVLVEEFSAEPRLMNWLFRHSNFDNRLAGAVVSGIVG